MNAVLTEVKKLVDDLDTKIVSLASGPGSLSDILDSIQGLVQRLNAVDLSFLTASIDELFTDVRSKLEALDPAGLAATLLADFDAVLDKIDPDLLLPKADLDALDSTYHGAIDKLKALDPGAIITDVLQRRSTPRSRRFSPRSTSARRSTRSSTSSRASRTS